MYTRLSWLGDEVGVVLKEMESSSWCSNGACVCAIGPERGRPSPCHHHSPWPSFSSLAFDQHQGWRSHCPMGSTPSRHRQETSGSLGGGLMRAPRCILMLA